MGFRTVLFAQHQEAGAKIVDFGGWDMPLHYGSQIEEHHAVRSDAGVFDVSHMTVVDFSGADVTDYLRMLLANDVAVLKQDGKALYSAMLQEDGGVIDDLITYRTGDSYRMVVNCATREKDLAWMRDQVGKLQVTIDERPDLAIVAVQGPNAIERVSASVTPPRVGVIERLKLFQGLDAAGWFIARTGYTGERGLELILPQEDAPGLWHELMTRGVKPCGLAARDSLRLEAGMNLYGNEMDESVSPLATNMEITVIWEPESRRFIGRQALENERVEGVRRELVGLVMKARGVMRRHQKVFSDDRELGEITSGTFSPTLGCSIAMASLEKTKFGAMSVEIRGRKHPVDLVRTPFVRNGKEVYKLRQD